MAAATTAAIRMGTPAGTNGTASTVAGGGQQTKPDNIPATNALLGNQIDVLATTLGGLAASQIQSGKLKGLGIAAQKRAAVVPNVPTYGESGFPGFYAASWVGIFAPSKTDPEILKKLNAAVEEVMKDPETTKKLASIGFDPIYGDAAEAEKYFRSEVANWGKMVNAVGLSIP